MKIDIGDCVAEVPGKPRDDGKRWNVEAIDLTRSAAKCRLIHPSRREERLIPLRSLVVIAREVPTLGTIPPGRLADFLYSRGKL